MAQRQQKDSVCIIIPLFNGRSHIRGAVEAAAKAMETLGCDYEIVISEDGSTDGSFQEAKALEGARVRVLHSERRLGKGRAISLAASESASDIIIFMDADLSASPAQAVRLMGAIERGFDIAIGSRLVTGSEIVGSSPVRGALSLAYNRLIRMLFRTGIQDHQCGFKAFRRSSALGVALGVSDNGWFWDTEFLVMAKRRGLAVSEVPVRWVGADKSTFSLPLDALAMAAAAMRLRLRLLMVGKTR